MKSPRPLVLDANILLRAVFGVRVRVLLECHEDTAAFYTSDVCLEDARRYIPDISSRRGLDTGIGVALLDQVMRIVETIDRSLYEEYEEAACARISSRDPEDSPVVAAALMLEAPIWTEDQDFFGAGIATWTSNRVEIYLRDS